MARFTHGIMGPFSGKVGTVVGATWKGIPYMRARPGKRTDVVSEKENANRKKFAKAQAWLSPILHFVRQGFKGYSPTVEGFVAAKSYLLKHALEGESDSMVINPSLVKVSYGNLPLSADIAVTKISPTQLQFTWNTDIPNDSNVCDQVMMLAYNIERKVAISVTTGQFRSTGADVMDLDSGTWHLYVAFVAHDRSRQSDSVYLGAVSLGNPL